MAFLLLYHCYQPHSSSYPRLAEAVIYDDDTQKCLCLIICSFEILDHSSHRRIFLLPLFFDHVSYLSFMLVGSY